MVNATTPTWHAPAMIARLLAVLAIATLSLAVPAPALAHATLVGSAPSSGDRLEDLPEQVRFEFSEEMSAPAYIVVTTPDGSSVTVGDPVVEGSEVSQELTDGPEGSYVVAFRAVSQDGHPLTGEIDFIVGDASAQAAEPLQQGGQSPDVGTSSDSPQPVAQPAVPKQGSINVDWTWLVSFALFGLAAACYLLAKRAPT